MRAVVQGVGHAVPDRVLTNDDMKQFVDTSDEWIRQRTGIRERRACSDGEGAGTLCTQAARNALASAGLGPEELDLIVVGTVTPDTPSPSVACVVQREVGAFRAYAFDISAACAGFIYSLSVADAMIRTEQARTALVIGCDVLTTRMRWEDRNTSVLFGDAAGAVVLSAMEDTDRGLLGSSLFADGSGADAIVVHPDVPNEKGRIHMAGSEVFRFAVQAMGDACERVLMRTGLRSDDIDLFVPHQANSRIIEAAAKRLELPMEKVFLNVEKYGNTSGGSIPLALSEAVQEGRLQPGMLVMTVGFGAGLVWGANVIRW